MVIKESVYLMAAFGHKFLGYGLFKCEVYLVLISVDVVNDDGFIVPSELLKCEYLKELIKCAYATRHYYERIRSVFEGLLALSHIIGLYELRAVIEQIASEI